ncbi:hypothetical protein GCM10010219_66170 [Streptomyces netropsis]|nr:hypothetical protein GCM10010219_66170 [Streptomyces netropsis]
MKKRVISYSVAMAVIVPVMAISTSGQAFADGNVQWKNQATGRCLAHMPGMVLAGDCDNPSTKWRDVEQSDGTYQQRWVDQCLDSNKAGKVYILRCENGNDNQKWYEQKTSTGWRLKNKATGRVLDSNFSGSVYTNFDEGDGNKHQRWA